MTTVQPIPKKKKRKKSKRQILEGKCDRLFSLIIRAGGKCESGRLARHGGTLQCAHGFSRSYKAIRWDRRNAWCLCSACHVYFTHRPLEWDMWLVEQWGADLYAEMRALALGGELRDLEELHTELKEAMTAAA